MDADRKKFLNDLAFFSSCVDAIEIAEENQGDANFGGWGPARHAWYGAHVATWNPWAYPIPLHLLKALEPSYVYTPDTRSRLDGLPRSDHFRELGDR